MIGGEQNPGVVRQRRLERRKRGVELVESCEPGRRAHPLGVPRHVELGNVDVDETGRTLAQKPHGRADARGDRLLGDESGTP